MTEQSNRKLVELYLAALSGKPKPAEVVSQYVDDKPLEEHIAFFEAAFPCYELRLDDIVAEGDKVALRLLSAAYKGTISWASLRPAKRRLSQ